jgi:hypothetical protein
MGLDGPEMSSSGMGGWSSWLMGTLMREPLVLQYPDLPPSANKLHFNLPGGGRMLTPIARTWKVRFTAWLGQKHLFTIHRLREMVDHGYVVCLDISLHLPLEEIVNPGWLKRYKVDTWVGPKGSKKQKKAGQRKAESRYKRIDVSNRYKLVEDAIAETFGVDDRSNFVVTGKKLVSDAPGVVVSLLLEDPRVFGIPEEYLGAP